MIGRDKQLQQIIQKIEAIIAGDSAENVLFITGEAGIGKSTLLNVVKEDCGTMSQLPLVAIVECSTPLAGQDIGEVEALAPWAEIMGKLASFEQEKKLETRRLVADLAMAWIHCIPVVGDVLESVADTATIVRDYRRKDGEASSGYAANQQQVFQQYINFLANLSERIPLVLMVDDFHWADTSSTNLLFAAARQLQGKPVLFIVAYRVDDAASSRGGEGHPLLHIRNELERYSLCAEISVPKMMPNDLDALLRERYANYQNNDAFEEWLAKISGGNALFITQFLNTLEEDGYIDEGKFNDRYDEVRVPSSAYAVVQERIRRLSEETKELLRYASVEGDTFTAAVLGKITESPQLKLLQKLRLAEETHRVVRSLGKHRMYSSETTVYQFTHVLLHKVMYDSLGQQERELIHEVVFNALKEEWEVAKETNANLSGIAARLAVHAEVIGENLFAAEALLAGARLSWKEFAEEETLRQIAGALTSLDSLEDTGSGETKKLRGELMLLRGDVHRVRARLEEALEAYRVAHSLFESTGDQELIAKAQSEQVEVLCDLSRYDETEELARTLLAEAERDGLLDAQAAAWNGIGTACYGTGRYYEGLDCFRRSLEIYRATGNKYGQALTLNNKGTIKTYLNDYAGAIEDSEESAGLCAEIGSRIGEASTLNNIGVAYLNLGDYSTALDYFERYTALSHRIGDRGSQTLALVNIGCTYLQMDQLEPALERLTQGLELATEISSPYYIFYALLNIGYVYSKQGDYPHAMEYAQRSLETANSIGNLGGRVAALRSIGAVERLLGEYDRSQQTLLEGLELSRQIGRRDHEAVIHGLLGLTAEQKALMCEGKERSMDYRKALEHLEECVRMAREFAKVELSRWEKELERVRTLMQTSV